MSESASCSVCGRTILKGERTRPYLTPEGERRTVCELCRTRAESLEWVWAELAGQHRPAPERRRRRSLSGLLRRRAESRAESGRQDEVAPDVGANGDSKPPPAPLRRDPDPAARGAGVGRSVPAREPGTRLERAVARFNASSHARTVSGLTRTLGSPRVSVGAAAGSPSEVRFTVAWELSWYQWGVDLAEPGRAVYEIDKGFEMTEIDAAAREWNAHLGEGGSVRLGSAPAPAVSSQPAGAGG